MLHGHCVFTWPLYIPLWRRSRSLLSSLRVSQTQTLSILATGIFCGCNMKLVGTSVQAVEDGDRWREMKRKTQRRRRSYWYICKMQTHIFVFLTFLRVHWGGGLSRTVKDMKRKIRGKHVRVLMNRFFPALCLAGAWALMLTAWVKDILCVWSNKEGDISAYK